MKRLSVLAAAAAIAWGVAPALAWNCPVQIRAAEKAIRKAEAMELSPEAKALLEQAKKLLAQAKADHIGAQSKLGHANAMWKAKAAQAQAESAAELSTP